MDEAAEAWACEPTPGPRRPLFVNLSAPGLFSDRKRPVTSDDRLGWKAAFFLVMKMVADKWAIEMAVALQARWREEIERAIDKVKGPKRTELDQWFRKQWYRHEWQMGNAKGPKITRD